MPWLASNLNSGSLSDAIMSEFARTGDEPLPGLGTHNILKVHAGQAGR